MGVYAEIEGWTSWIRGAKREATRCGGRRSGAHGWHGGDGNGGGGLLRSRPLLHPRGGPRGQRGRMDHRAQAPGPYLLLVSLLLLGYAFRRVYGRRVTCSQGSPPTARRVSLGRITLGLLWLSALVWAGAVVAYFTLR